MIDQYDKERYTWHIVFRMFSNRSNYPPETSLAAFVRDTDYDWKVSTYKSATLTNLCGDPDD